MRIAVEYFGKLGDFAGAEDGALDLPVGVSDTAALRAWLDEVRGFNGALLHCSVQIAVGDEIRRGPFALSEGDIVAFLPPVGGG
ncbi:MAG: MoaD/ThiS family protein [Pseudomonadota bacterium]